LEIKKIIDELSKIINLKFQLIDILNDFSADIRISCNENNFSWSPIGTDIYLNEYKDKPNMNLKELDDIKHEFGHMLGLDHEHQKLGLNIEWDQIKIVDLIMKNYNINEITEASTIYKTNFDEINNNLNIDQSIDFDADSVMCYFFSKEYYKNPTFIFKKNKNYSSRDLDNLKRIYPIDIKNENLFEMLIKFQTQNNDLLNNFQTLKRRLDILENKDEDKDIKKQRQYSLDKIIEVKNLTELSRLVFDFLQSNKSEFSFKAILPRDIILDYINKIKNIRLIDFDDNYTYTIIKIKELFINH